MAVNTLTISPESLADRVVSRLQEAVTSGEFAPGERLTEPALAELLGISRSPVREALLRLEALGLARRRNNYSTYVWEPSERDVDEIMNLRLMLESHAATQVIDRLDDADYAHLEELIRRQEQAIRDQAYLPLVRTEREFHEYPVRKTGNSRLMEWWDQIMSQWEVLVVRRWYYDPAKVVPRVLVDHRAIVNGLRQRDLPKLLLLHREINAEVCEETKKMLRVQAAAARPAQQAGVKGEEVTESL